MMEGIKKKFFDQRVIWFIVWVIVALLSIFVISRIVSDPNMGLSIYLCKL